MAFGWQSVGHFFAAAAHGVVQAAKIVTLVEKKIQAAAPVAEAITSLVSPQAAALERGAFAVFGVVAAAVEAADEAGTQHGLNVALDATMIADIKAILPAVKEFAAAQGWAKP